MTLTRITIMIGQDCTDRVYLYADLPSPLPTSGKPLLTLNFETQQDCGREYVRTNFPGVPVTVIDLVTGRISEETNS